MWVFSGTLIISKLITGALEHHPVLFHLYIYLIIIEENDPMKSEHPQFFFDITL